MDIGWVGGGGGSRSIRGQSGWVTVRLVRSVEMKENYYIGLVPEIASFVTGLDEVERLIGKGCVFHDAEIELVHLDRKARAAM